MDAKRFARPDRAIHSSGATLLRRFTVVSLVTTVAVGALFGAAAARVLEEYALRRQAATAALYVSEFVAPRLVPQDFLLTPSARRVQFEFALHDLAGKAGIIRVTVWNRRGQVLYSNDRKLSGRTFPLSPSVRGALGGKIQWQQVDPPQGAEAGHQRMEVFVPVKVAGVARPVAVYDVLTDLTDLEVALIRLKWSVWVSVVLGILVLYVMLFTVVHKASRDLERQQATLRRAFVGTVESLARAVDARDMATANHSSLVADYAEGIARTMGLTAVQISDARVAGFLHDLGKIGIRDGILTKPGPLTDEEWEIMRRHPVLGYEILQPVPIAERIKVAVRHSHERWDGHGYPDGLAGEEIPIAARVIAVADAYEALTTDRPYRTGRSPEEALQEIRRCSGTQFDPQAVTALFDLLRQRMDRSRSHEWRVPAHLPAVGE